MKISTAALSISAACFLVAPGMLDAQVIRGRVVVEPTRAGIPDANVALLALDSTVLGGSTSNADGLFELTPPGIGHYRISVTLIGYSSAVTDVDVSSMAPLTVPAIVLRQEAVSLDPVEARVARDSLDTVVGFARSTHLLSGSRLATLERHATSTASALQTLGAGIQIREGPRTICVRAPGRGIRDMRDGALACMPVVLDGILISNGPEFLYYLHLEEAESIRYLPPVEAGFRYGLQASATGAIEIWTRGAGPYRSESRNGGGG